MLDFGRSGFRMLALCCFNRTACALSQAEKTGTRPMGPSNLTRDNGEGPIAPAMPFEPVGMDKHGMGDAPPFPHKARASLQRNWRRRLARVACLRVEFQALQLAQDRFGEAAERPLLEFVGDPTDQEVAGKPHRRRRPMQPPPLATQLEDRQRREPLERLCSVDRRFGHLSDPAAFRYGSGGRQCWPWTMSARSRASFSPCRPGTHARYVAASRSPASSLRCWPLRVDSAV